MAVPNRAVPEDPNNPPKMVPATKKKPDRQFPEIGNKSSARMNALKSRITNPKKYG